jgi:glutamate dehydrogenase
MAGADVMALPAGDFLRKMYGLTIQTTDLETYSFPEYVDPFEASASSSNSDTMTGPQLVASLPKVLASKLKAEPDRHPSPQPTHLGGLYLNKANGNGHRTMRSATLGYIAPEFKGKAEQMKQGMLITPSTCSGLS